jgi:hypothetical protein
MYTMLATATNDLLSITLTPQMLTIIPLLAVAIQALKAIEPLAKLKAWFPLITIAAAMALAVILKMGDDVQSQLVAGIVMGLATSGGYDAAKVSTKVTETTTATTTTDGEAK